MLCKGDGFVRILVKETVTLDELKRMIRDVPNFPQQGIVFKDITTLLKEGEAFRKTIQWMAEHSSANKVDLIVGTESRGFIFGAALACQLGCGFVPVRKPGKLPAETIKEEYSLEYGTDAGEIHKDSIREGQRVVVVDDLLATGGTISATCNLVEKLGGNIEKILFLIELSFLNGRSRLHKYDGKVHSLLCYDAE